MWYVSFSEQSNGFFSEESLESKLVMVQVGEFEDAKNRRCVALQCRGIVATSLPETNN